MRQLFIRNLVRSWPLWCCFALTACTFSLDTLLGCSYAAGVITFTIPPMDATVAFPYQYNFSLLGLLPRVAGKPADLIFDGHTLVTPFGVRDMGSFATDDCGHAIPVREDAAAFYTRQFRQHPLVAPLDGYMTTIPLEPCHLYVIRTSHGQYALFLNIGSYIGAYDRQHFFWLYKLDGSRELP